MKRPPSFAPTSPPLLVLVCVFTLVLASAAPSAAASLTWGPAGSGDYTIQSQTLTLNGTTPPITTATGATTEIVSVSAGSADRRFIRLEITRP